MTRNDQWCSLTIFSQSGFFQPPPPDPFYTYIRTHIQTDGDYIKRVVHGPSGDHTLKNINAFSLRSSRRHSLQDTVTLYAHRIWNTEDRNESSIGVRCGCESSLRCELTSGGNPAARTTNRLKSFSRWLLKCCPRFCKRNPSVDHADPCTKAVLNMV